LDEGIRLKNDMDASVPAAHAFNLPSTQSSPIQTNGAYSGIKHAY